MSKILEVIQVNKKYASGERELTVLDDISFDIEQGDSVAVVGPSGSGKTTLLGLCAGLDSPTGGEILLESKSLKNMTEDDRAELRNRMVGFIFQNFQLLPSLTALENARAIETRCCSPPDNCTG
jgi:putative ABC transport system ATP-binding protein